MTKEIPKLSEALEAALVEHLNRLRVQIVSRASDLASESSTGQSSGWAPGGVPINFLHLSRAIQEVAPSNSAAAKSASVASRVSDALSSFTGVAAILALLFATLGLCALLLPRAADLKMSSQGFLDIAKIFAGAVVGSAGATVVAGRKGGRA